MQRAAIFGILLLPFLFMGAAPSAHPDRLLREGDAAFARSDYETALKCYEQAQARTTNPGRIAGHQAAALYRLGQFAAAEEHYRCALDDAVGSRRAGLLFDLGNCLLQRAGESRTRPDARLKIFAEAVRCYQAALQQDGASDDLQANVRHNLELARLFWGLARQERANKDEGSESEPKNDPPEPKKPPPATTEGGDLSPGARPDPNDPGTKVDPGLQPLPQLTPEQGPPGKGQIKPLAEDDHAVPLSPEDAARHLDWAAAKIRERQRAAAHATTATTSKGRNW